MTKPTIKRIPLDEMRELAAQKGGRLTPSITHYAVVTPLCGWCHGPLAACSRGEGGCCGYGIDNGTYAIASYRAAEPGLYWKFVRREEM